MAEFERGQTFLDKSASNMQGTKAKYYIAMNNADYDDDLIICFVLNSENNFDKFKLDCNKRVGKFILDTNSLSFIKRPTSIMLKIPVQYTLNEILNSKSIILQGIANDKLKRQIKNCIDFGFIRDDWAKLIKDSFK